mmetsp:Transcript_21307/g.44461  ORF Transcript_21307/g.44461 Transcript_21307/m.44461 type:complete len:325 (+) Transcript_21307:20-994(+)
MTPNITNRRNQSSVLTITQRRATFILLSISFILWIITSHFSTSPTSTSSISTSATSSSYRASSTTTTSCLVSHGTYSGSIYAKPRETLHNKCLVESPWMRLAQHSVQLQPSSSSGASNSGNDGKGKVIDDWLWIDYHDRINVLVEAPFDVTADGSTTSTTTTTTNESSFLILTQTKYALPSSSLAIVGGIIEPEEEALDAARREVHEELGVSCNVWKVLGNRFRTDVNRGMGWVHPYLARDCSYSSNTDTNNNNNNNAQNNHDANNDNPNNEEKEEEVGGRDTEKQHLRIMKLSDVKKAVMDGRFMEVQWSNTVALAMLHLSLE